MVEKSYFETIDDALAEKAHLSNYLPPHNEVLTHTAHILQNLFTSEKNEKLSILVGFHGDQAFVHQCVLMLSHPG